MSDPFKNARAFYDVTVPSSGDGFQIISQLKNSLQGLGFMDMIPLQPRAHSPADTKIMIRGRDASSFYNPCYTSDSNSRIPFASGDSPAFNTPASNPRIDIVYITPSGDIRIVQGTEAAVPTLPTLSPSGDTRMPVCAVYNKPGQARIVNFETKDSSTGDGYIYQDLRPWLNQPKSAGGSSFSASTPVSPTGDGQASAGSASTSARSDHSHGGLHAVRNVGSANLQGDIEFEGPINQQGNRIIIANISMSHFKNLVVTRPSAGSVKVTFDDLTLQDQSDRAASARKKSITIDFANGTGINGLDTGAEAANTIYYVWILRKSVDGTIGGVFSLNSTTGPTLPSGYDQQALVSAGGNDNSSNLINFTQTGRKYCFTVWGTMASGNVGGAAWIAVPMTPANMSTNAAFIAPGLSNYGFGVASGQTDISVTNDSTIAANINATAPNKYMLTAAAVNLIRWEFDLITPNTIYWLATNASAALYLHGFEINKLS